MAVRFKNQACYTQNNTNTNKTSIKKYMSFKTSLLYER